MNKKEIIKVANLKCDGCSTTISNKLTALKGVSGIVVNQEEDSVVVEHDGSTNREVFTETLRSLGYPEATEENGLLMKLKSYVSCAIGRVNK